MTTPATAEPKRPRTRHEAMRLYIAELERDRPEHDRSNLSESVMDLRHLLEDELRVSPREVLVAVSRVVLGETK